MCEEDKNFDPRVKTVEEAVRLLKELTLKAGVRMDDFDTSLSNLRARLETPGSTQFCASNSLGQPTNTEMSMDQCLAALMALARKSHNKQ